MGRRSLRSGCAAVLLRDGREVAVDLLLRQPHEARPRLGNDADLR